MGANLGLADRATYDPTKTQMALPLETPPTIDGVIDTAVEWRWAQGVGPSWVVRPDAALDDGIRGGAVANGSVSESNEDLSFDIYAGYDADNLYIAVRVRDSVLVNDSAEADSVNGSTWLDDSVEVFVDGDNSNFATRDTTGTNPEVVATGGQYVITANNAYREAEAGNPGYGETMAWFAKTALREDGSGYDAEFRISLKTIGSPKVGDIIGFSLAVNDDDLGGNAQRQLIWVGATHVEESYGNLLIGTRAYEAPKTKAPTIDGKINSAEYAGANEIKIDPHTGQFEMGAGDDTFEATDLGFSAWAVHDADAIYVAIDVIDDNVVSDTAEAGSEDGSTWEDDSMEIFFDADLAREFGHSATLQFEGQYVFTANGAWRDNEALNPTFGADTDWFAATSKTDRGYQVEFKVKKSALANPADGATVGFHICQNEDDGAGRSGAGGAQVGWSGRAHNEFTYGTLKLGGEVLPPPKPTLSIARSGADVMVTYTGTLQGAVVVTGPFTDVAGATSPYKVPLTGAAKLYRSKN
jgi:hypothetical protein